MMPPRVLASGSKPCEGNNSCYSNKTITVYESCYTFDCDLVALDFITGITYQLLLGETFFIVGVNTKQFRLIETS